MITHSPAGGAIRTLSSKRGYAKMRSAPHLAGFAPVVGRLRVTNVTRIYRWGDRTVVRARLIVAAVMHPGMRRRAILDPVLASRARTVDALIALQTPVPRLQAGPVRGAGFGPYAALISPGTLRLRPGKALSACVLATVVLSAPAHIDASEGYELANLVVSIAKAHVAHATTDDVQIVLAMKHGLRRATVVFGRLSPRNDPRNIPTMTSGIRN